MMAMLVPSVTSVNSAGDVTAAAYAVDGVLENARTYAMANNTYVWVGFFEQNTSYVAQTTTASSGTGQIVISVVASQNGTMIYNPGSLPISSASMSAGLVQVNKLVKINNMHLKTAGTNDPNNVFPVGTGTGTTFAGRPFVSGSSIWQIGDAAVSGTASQTPFQYPLQYPLGSPLPAARYTFTTAIQFNPRGEAVVMNTPSPGTAPTLQPVIEIGLQPTHGTSVATANANVAAVQITGITGNVKIYRK
jgi:hypothetical protein